MILKIIILYLISINAVSTLMYVIDKHKAQKGKWRTTEFSLIMIAYLGGSIGALIGMYIFRHKTKHIKFRILVPLAFLIHIGIAIWFYMH